MSERRLPPNRRTGADRRERPRLTVAASLRFLRAGAAGDEVLHGELLDVSATGLRLKLGTLLAPADRILVEVRDDDHCLNLSAQVIWVETAPEAGHHVGCELSVEMTRKQTALLRRWMHQHV